jgi:[ribosomal protein S18]-alanine N-acetyltransferase
MKEVKQKIIYSLRPMEDRDIPQVLEIDHEAFPTQWPFPTYSSFKQELRNRLAHYVVVCKPNYDSEESAESNIFRNNDHKTLLGRLKQIFSGNSSYNATLLPPAADLVLGMSGFWLMVGEVHIITIAARSAFRGMGIGEAMLITMIEKAFELDANVVTLEVRVSNTGPQQLYKKYGFITVGTRRKYYTDNGEDALIMTTDNIKTPAFRSRFQLLREEHEHKWGNNLGI